MTTLPWKKGAEEAPETSVIIPTQEAALEGDLSLPPGAKGIVVFAHGSGSSRHSARNRFVAAALRGAGLATLLVDLRSADEEAVDGQTAHLRFDVAFVSERLAEVIDWMSTQAETSRLPIGLFGSSTGAPRRWRRRRNDRG